MATFSFVLGGLLLQFTVVSQFATVYAQIIKKVFVTIIALCMAMLVIVAAFSFMASSMFPVVQFQDRGSSFLFTLLSFSHFTPYISFDKN